LLTFKAPSSTERSGVETSDSNVLVRHIPASDQRTSNPPPSIVAEKSSGALERGRCLLAENQAQKFANRSLRPEQLNVLYDFERYLSAVNSDQVVGNYARIVLPPRTGKTVIAGHILARCGLSAIFVVPTRVLVEQTREELKLVHPELAIGTFYGEERELAPKGVNITTYSMLDRLNGTGEHSAVFRDAKLVFLDEAHHCMTSERLRRIRELFADEAIRLRRSDRRRRK
jgi:superfamily II DNA or RNA helicase